MKNWLGWALGVMTAGLAVAGVGCRLEPGANSGAPPGGGVGAGPALTPDSSGGPDGGVVPPSVGSRISPTVNPAVHDTCATRTPAGWCWVSPRPQGSSILDVSAARAGELWAVGAAGAVLHASAGAWELLDVGLAGDLTAVSAASDGAVWIGSSNGNVVRGDAAGGWAKLPPPGLARITAVWAAGRDESWAVGNDATVYHWTPAGSWIAADLGLDAVSTVTGRAADDVWMVTLVGHFAHWDGQGWTTGDIAIEPRSPYPWTQKSLLFFRRTGVLDDGTVWASAVSDIAGLDGYFLAGGAWLPSGGYTLTGASMADHWASGARGAVIHVSPLGPDATNEILVGDRPLLVGRAGDLWAVGGTAIRHNNGGGWDSPPVLFSRTSYVAASSANDVWVTGANESGRGAVGHWDGGSWSMFALGDNVITGPAVAVNASGNAWFAGTSLWHWNGHTLDELPYPPSLLPASTWFGTHVAAPPGGGVWVLASSNSGAVALLRFDAQGWQRIPLPAAFVSYAYGNGFAATSDSDLWLIGGHTIHHYDGAQWSDPTILEPTNDGVVYGIRAVLALAPNDVWAGPYHFDGVRWTSTLPPPATSLGEIYGSWASADDDLWMTTSTGLRHWDGRSWSVPLSLPGTSVWASMSGTGPHDVWIAGWDGLIHGATARPDPRSF